MSQTVKVPEINLSLSLDKLQQINQGGEGTIYSIDSSWVIKIFHDPLKEQAEKIRILEKCFSQKERLWSELEYVATIPKHAATNANGKIIGYVMENRTGWLELNTLYDGKGSLRVVLGLFADLHGALCAIHKRGFAVGDLNGGNILFSRLTNTGSMIQIIDTDSWSIDRPDLGVIHKPMIQDPEVIHPEHLKAQNDGRPLPSFLPKHDWWIFAYLLTKCLTGSDPFEQGNFLGLSDTQRRQEGLSAMHKGADLGSSLYYALYLRMGLPLKHLLKRWLSRSQEGVFPIALLESTMQEIENCPHCQREINNRLALCPYPDCGQLL